MPLLRPALPPAALLHNLKHNRVLHDHNVIVTVQTLEAPRALDEERLSLSHINPDFTRIIVRYGFMETPNIPAALAACRPLGFVYDPMATSFFLGRKTVVPGLRKGLRRLQDRLFILLAKNEVNATEAFHIPPGRVLEMGGQISL